MIVSASYRTDIPAFYAEWFRRRLQAGFCRVVNPYNPDQISTVPLRPPAVSGFVFWTKNLGPFREALAEVADLGVPFVVQYTVNGYPRALETSVCEPERAAAHLQELRDRYGPRVGVWRYDPVLHTSLTPAAFHRDRFGALAEQLRGVVDEVIVSFAFVYKKTRRNTEAAARRHGFTWWDPAPEEKRRLLADFLRIAEANGLRLSICAQAELRVPGVREARCIDAERLAAIAGRPIPARKSPHRPACGCYESRDIGAYDSCPHGCVYCYAVQRHALARRRYRAHDPDNPLLVPPRA